MTAIERFEKKIEVISETGCWIWMACVNRDGYGQFSIRHKVISAHVFAYRQFRGPVPEGMELDHTCRVRCCVNPFHLEAVPHRTNCQRGEVGKYLKRRTHCPRGHAYNEKNTGRQPNGRRCRACDRERAQEWRDRQKLTPGSG